MPLTLQRAVATFAASNRDRVLVCVGARGLRDVSLHHHSNYDFQNIQWSGYNGPIKSAWKAMGEREQRAHPGAGLWGEMEPLHYLVCTAGSRATYTHRHMQNP